jgi:hypothetical protein
MDSLLIWCLYGFLGFTAGLLPIGLIALRLTHLKHKGTLPLKLMPQTLLNIHQAKSAYIVMGAQFLYSLIIFSILPIHASHIGFIAGCQIQSPRPFQTQINLIPLLAYLVGQTSTATIPVFLFICAFIYKPFLFKQVALTLLAFAPIWLTLTLSTETGLISLAIALMILAMHRYELITA